MSLIPGRLAMVHRSDSRPYASGVHFLARIIRETLGLAFFYRRLTDQLASGGLRGLDYEQARFCHIACFDTIAVNISKLLENRTDTWNFTQLHKEWRRYIHDESTSKAAMNAIDDLRAELAWIEDYRHSKAAHQTKADELTTLTALPPDIKGLSKVVTVMDLFVEGQIPYTLYLHESGQELDLRKEFQL